MANDLDPSRLEEILAYLRQLEGRVSRLESQLSHPATEENEVKDSPSSAAPPESDAEEKLELQIGQNWFAKIGIVVLALGVVFLLTFPYQNLPPAIPSILGYFLVGGILVLSSYLRESFPQTSRYLLGGALLLLYVATLRLSRFSAQPAVENTTVEFVLLLLIVAVDLVISFRVRSAYLIGLSLALGYLTALVYGKPYGVFTLILSMSVVAIYAQWSLRLNALPLFALVLAYLTHALWAINNPFFGGDLQLLSAPEANLPFLLGYVLSFAVGTLAKGRRKEESTLEIAGTFLNGSGSYGLLLLLTLTSFSSHIFQWQIVASLEFLAISIAFWVHLKSTYATFVYAMLGYAALSAAIIAEFQMPDSFVWLCWQAVLVLTTAVWFRSRFIVVANFIIYLIVFTAYLFTVRTAGVMSLSFGIVALVSARILNWQKDRLELRTELMRNAYLLCALFVIPYALYHSVPPGVVSLSWLVVALLYYLISRYLSNRKYRWMALMTMLLTILYVLLVDLVAVDPLLRVISFLTLGIALLAISMFYSRKKQRVESQDNPGNTS